MIRKTPYPPAGLIDSHVHLDDERFDADRDMVLVRAAQHGVEWLIVPAIDHLSWPRIRQLAGANACIKPAYGLHPMYIERHRPEHLDELTQWLARGDAVAVGELGLDFYLEGLDAERQWSFFRRQLELARSFELPVIVHARRAVEEVIQAIKAYPGLRGVVHSFAGSEVQARQLWKLGFYIGIGGPVTYERARRLRHLVAGMPLEYLLLESDAPDQPDATQRGQRNEPACVAKVLACVAALRGDATEEIARITTRNACRLFGLPSPPNAKLQLNEPPR